MIAHRDRWLDGSRSRHGAGYPGTPVSLPATRSRTTSHCLSTRGRAGVSKQLLTRADWCVQPDDTCPDDGTGLKIAWKANPPALQFFDYTTPAN